MKLLKLLPALAIFALTSAAAFAQAIVPTYKNYASTIGGTTADYKWDLFSDVNRPAGVSASISGAASEWLAGIKPQGGANITFSGSSAFGSDTTDFLAASNGGGIYGFFSQTHFQINSVVPLTGMQSLVVQLALAEGEGGVTLVAAPTLTVVTSNGTVSNIAATYSLLASSTAATILGMTTNVDLLNYQWDLSGISGTISSYTVSWQMPAHGIYYGQEVTESTAVHANNVLVPEPSAGIAVIGGAAMLMAFRRIRRSALV